MKRSYCGPVIEHGVEYGILGENSDTTHAEVYALAVDRDTGDFVLLLQFFGVGAWYVSGSDPKHIYNQVWRASK